MDLAPRPAPNLPTLLPLVPHKPWGSFLWSVKYQFLDIVFWSKATGADALKLPQQVFQAGLGSWQLLLAPGRCRAWISTTLSSRLSTVPTSFIACLLPSLGQSNLCVEPF